MHWVVILLTLFGIIGHICTSYRKRMSISHSPSSDVSRTSNISVSSYLRTAAAVHGQDDMGNDMLMARVDLTPVLDGHVSLIRTYNPSTQFNHSISTPQTSGITPQLAPVPSISKSTSNRSATNLSQSKPSIFSKSSAKAVSAR